MAMKSSSVEILPESDNVLACVKYSGIVRENDCRIFHLRLESNLSESGRLKILTVFDKTFRGWEIDAAEADLGSMLEYAGKAEKIALVNPPPTTVFQMKVLTPLFGNEVKFFEEGHFAEALEWIKRDSA